MKGGVRRNVMANTANKTKPPAHMRRGDGRPGQKFNADRFAELCIRRKVDPAEAALQLLKDPKSLAELKAKEKLDAYIRLMEYAYPKKRAVEGNLEVSGTLVIECVTDFGE